MRHVLRWFLTTALLASGLCVFAIDYNSQDVQTAYDRHDVRQLMNYASTADKPIRLEALQSLIQLKDPQAVPFLVQQLDDPDPEMVISASWGLPTFGTSAATPDVMDRVESLQQNTSKDVRRTAEIVLDDLKDPEKLQQMRQNLTSKEEDQRKESLDFYAKRGDQSILPEARDMLQDTDPVKKQTGIILIHGLDDHDSLTSVEKLLEDPAPGVRAAAVMVVGDWKEVSSLDLLRPLLKDPDPLVRASIVSALSNHQNPEVSIALASLSKDHDPTVCINLAEALAKFATPASAEGLVTLALENNPLIRESAIQGLVAFHDPAITKRMRIYLTDKTSRKRRRAAIAYLSNPTWHTPSTTFLPLVHDKDAEIRLAAAQAILQLPGNTTKAQLVYLMEDPDRDVRLLILKKIDMLILIPKVNKRVIKKSLSHLQKDPDPEVLKLAQKYKALAG